MSISRVPSFIFAGSSTSSLASMVTVDETHQHNAREQPRRRSCNRGIGRGFSFMDIDNFGHMAPPRVPRRRSSISMSFKTSSSFTFSIGAGLKNASFSFARSAHMALPHAPPHIPRRRSSRSMGFKNSSFPFALSCGLKNDSMTNARFDHITIKKSVFEKIGLQPLVSPAFHKEESSKSSADMPLAAPKRKPSEMSCCISTTTDQEYSNTTRIGVSSGLHQNATFEFDDAFSGPSPKKRRVMTQCAQMLLDSRRART